MCACELEKRNVMSVFHDSIESRRDLLNQATERILRRVQAMPGVPAELDDLHLSLSEAITNAVIHGNHENPHKNVRICGGIDPDHGLVLVVTDEGPGFDPALIPDPTSDPHILASHGRGVFLMQRLMDHVEFRYALPA